MRRLLKIFGLAALALALVCVALLAVTGVPRPPAITTDGVPRVPWKRVWEMVSGVRDMQALTRFANWVPGEEGILVGAGMTRRIHHVPTPGAALEPIEGLPPGAHNIVFGSDSEQGTFVFAWDEGGSELYRLGRYDWRTGTTEALTEQPARGTICCAEPAGERIAYASTARNGEDFDLYLIDPRDASSATRVLEADGEFWPAAWSPDGRHLAVTRFLSHTRNALYLFDIETREMLRVLPEWGDDASFESAEWSADGRSLFFSSDYQAEFHRLRRYDLASGSVTTLAEEIPWDVIDLELTPDGTRIAFLVNEDSSPTLHVMDLAGGASQQVVNAPPGHIRAQLGFDGLHMHPRRNQVAVDVTPPSGFISVYSYDLDSGEWTRWTQPGPDETTLPPVEIIRYPSFDLVAGVPRQIPAAVFRPPPSSDAPYPVLITIHGGPAMQAGPVLLPIFVGLQAGGIAVISPNVRGSSGYGKSYSALDDQRHREDAVRDIGKLLDWIATQPDLDADRVAVMGASYGGYMALASLVHYSDRLRCGVDMFGISNFVTFLRASEEHHFPEAQRAEFGDERDREMRGFLESISPLNHAERITVPLMIYQGANDVRIKAQESRQMVERIRSAGGTVYYIEAADEGHDLSQPLNMLFVGAAYAQFFNECLLD